jgi:hypothetical protein
MSQESKVFSADRRIVDATNLTIGDTGFGQPCQVSVNTLGW